MGMTWEQRHRALTDSASLYEERGLAAVALAIRQRVATETDRVGRVVGSMETARVTRDAPETVAEFVRSVSFEDSGGCGDPGCRAFILGAEVGLLLGRLDNAPSEWNGTYHAENEEVLRRVADARGYDVALEHSADPAWVFCTFTPARKEPQLTVVPPPQE